MSVTGPPAIASMGSKFRSIQSTPTEIASTSGKDFECLASTGVNTPEIMSPTCRSTFTHPSDSKCCAGFYIASSWFATLTRRLLRVQGHSTPQFVEEVQQEDHAVVWLFGRIGSHERDNAFAIWRRIIAPRRAEDYGHLLRPDARPARHE